MDRTNYLQSLTNMVKGSLGAGILAMPDSFMHAGLLCSSLGLPVICFIVIYTIHLLVQSSRRVSERSPEVGVLDYGLLAKESFKSGTGWMQRSSGAMSYLIDLIQITTLMGVCSVYYLFVVENMVAIAASCKIQVDKTYIFIAFLPIFLALGCIRTLKRLAIGSTCANFIQLGGTLIILQYLLTDLGTIDWHNRDVLRPFEEVALGLGSALFAFEGITSVLPIYNKMRNQDTMLSTFGVANVAYSIITFLYIVVGLLGYLRFGHDVKGSITLNLPEKPIYDLVRLAFALGIMLTYPLQLYVLTGAVLSLFKAKDGCQDLERLSDELTSRKSLESSVYGLDRTHVLDQNPIESSTVPQNHDDQAANSLRREYICRVCLILTSFTIAFSVPRLYLLMDLIGSMTGTALCLIIPAVVHLAVFWNDLTGRERTTMIIKDSTVITLGLLVMFMSSTFSIRALINSFR